MAICHKVYEGSVANLMDLNYKLGALFDEEEQLERTLF